LCLNAGNWLNNRQLRPWPLGSGTTRLGLRRLLEHYEKSGL